MVDDRMQPGGGRVAANGAAGGARAGSLWRGGLGGVLAAAFPVVLWAFATLYFGGRLGLWNDDYQWIKRDPATGAVLRWTEDMGGPFLGGGQFWRPLHFLITTAGWTAFYRHDWVMHGANALAHGLASWLLFRLLIALGQTRHAAGAGSLLFLTFPAAWQTIFWPSALSTGLGVSAFLALCLLYVRWARGGAGWWRGWRGWGWVVLVMAPLAFAIPCLNEQPATGVAALPLLYWAVCPSGEPWGRRVVRAIVPAALCCLMCAAYLALYRATSRASLPGTAGSFTPLADVPAKAAAVAVGIGELLFLRRFKTGAMAEGLAALRGWPLATTLWVAALAATGSIWLGWWSMATPRAEGGISGRGAGASGGEGAWGGRRVGAFAFLFGAAVFAIGWTPMVMIAAYSTDSRLAYAPLVGAVIAGAAAGDALYAALFRPGRVGGGVGARGGARERGGWAAGPVRAGVGLVLVAGLLGGAVMLIGVQSALRTRHRLDVEEGAALRAALPAPAPETLFVPVWDGARWPRTGSARFDGAFYGAWSFWWTARWHIKMVYGRSDVECGFTDPWGSARPIEGADEAGVRAHWTMAPAGQDDPSGGLRVPWGRVIPFVIEEDGGVRLATHAVIERADNSDPVVPIPQAAAAAGRGTAERFEARFQDPLPVAGVAPISGWRWVETGKAVVVAVAPWWGVRWTGMSMHPAYPGYTRGAAVGATLPPSADAATAHFRVTFPEPTIGDSVRGDGVEFIWYLTGQRDRPLARFALLPRAVERERRYYPVSFTIPAHAGPVDLVAEVLPGPAGETYFDGCWMTAGYMKGGR